MSVSQSSFSKRAAPALSLNIASRPLSLQVESISSNKENYPEASTPHLPKKTKFNSRIGLSIKKSCASAQDSDNVEEIVQGNSSPLLPLVLPEFSPAEPKSALLRKKKAETSYTAAQECEIIEEVSMDQASALPPLELPEFTLSEPKSALLKKKKAETSYTVEESLMVTEITTAATSVSVIERDFNEDLYNRAEEYLDSQHLVIVLPEDHRRRPFGNLRVSTARVPQSDPTVPTDFNSPSLISPSIHTSSLIVRRSSSKKMDNDSTPAKQKLLLAKSPFYSCSEKGRKLFGIDTTVTKEITTENEEVIIQEIVQEIIEENSTPKNGLNVITSLNLKFTGLSLRASREPSEVSSATSFRMEDDSPSRV